MTFKFKGQNAILKEGLFMRLFFHSEQRADPILWRCNREVLGVRMTAL
jgi:hypothetical protein